MNERTQMRYWPLAQGTFRVGSPFGYRPGGLHAGQDFEADDGTPFYACQAGTVKYIGAADGYGQWIVLDHSDEEGSGVTEYGHMWDAFATGLKVGDHVEAGQLIGYVGSNGQSTGPHLHLAVMPREYAPSKKIDPLPWLEGASYVGQTAPAKGGQFVGDPQWGIDVSNHQGNFDFAAARSEGFTFATHKIIEGDFYKDPYWPRALDEMRKHFPGTFGGYVFCKVDSNPEREADLLASYAPKDVPIQIDYEDLDRNGSIADLWARINAIKARGYDLLPIYLPRWYWQGRMGAPDLSGLPVPIWNSDYGSNRQGYASVIYPGNNDGGWADMGGKPVSILQFAERGYVAGQFRVDVNAFRGTEQDLRALFASSLEDDLPYTRDELKSIIFECLETFVGPIGSDVKDMRWQMVGSRDSIPGDIGASYPGHTFFGRGRTQDDAIAAIGEKLGIDGMYDPKSATAPVQK